MNSEVRVLAQHLLHRGLTPLCERDRRLISRIARRTYSRDLNKEFEERLTLGQRLSDRVAAVGGSWTFIAGFGAFLAAWALLNGVLLARHAIDPYPFIFLNLLLSMLAAVQAPIIMMSQNRQVAKDRLEAALDYEVNLKAEVSIAELHEKIDRLEQTILSLKPQVAASPALRAKRAPRRRPGAEAAPLVRADDDAIVVDPSISRLLDPVAGDIFRQAEAV